MFKSLALALILIGSTPPRVLATRAQESPSSAPAISGTVRDPSGAVVPHVRVLLQSGNGKEPQETTSDSNGNFHFDKLPAGPYRLTIQSPGFKDESLTVKIGTKRLAPLRITLSLATQLETLTVGGADSSPQIDR